MPLPARRDIREAIRYAAANHPRARRLARRAAIPALLAGFIATAYATGIIVDRPTLIGTSAFVAAVFALIAQVNHVITRSGEPPDPRGPLLRRTIRRLLRAGRRR